MTCLTSILNWTRTHKTSVLVHSLIWTCFICYALFLSETLFARFEIIPGEAGLVQIQMPDEENNLRFELEKLINSKDVLEIQGWAFIDGYSSDNNQVFIVFKSTANKYIFDTSTVWSNPVTDLYGGPGLNLDWAGFSTIIPLRKIENGEFLLGICVKRGDLSALQYSNKTLSKTRAGVKINDIIPESP